MKKIFPLAFFIFIKESLLVHIQTIHQQKAWDLSCLEPEGQARGMVRRVPRLLAATDTRKKSKFDGAKSGPRKKKFRFDF